MAPAHSARLNGTGERGNGSGLRNWWPEIQILSLGLLASLGVYCLALEWETRERAASLHEQVEVYAQALEATLGELVGDVRALAQYYDASEEVDAAEFARFVRPFLEQHRALRALEWVPRVRDAERSAFETRARAKDFSDFAILEPLAGAPRPAGPRPEYFPVYRVAPLSGNVEALGTDLGADPLYRAALERSRDTGQPTASAPLVLVHGNGDRRGLMIFVPQFREGLAGDTPDARRERLQGFAVGVLRLKDLTEEAIAALPHQALDLVLRDADLPGVAGLLHVHPSRGRQTGAPLDLAALDRDPRGQEVRLTVAGRTLALRGLPAPGTKPVGPLPRALLGLGVAVSVAVALWFRYRRATAVRLLERKVRFTERKQAAQALRQSEARYRLLHESLRDPFARVAMDGRIVEFNDLFCRMLGYSPDELYALTYQDLTPERWHAMEERIVREQIIPRGYSDVYEKEYRRKDGTIVPVELRTILSRDESGRPSAMWALVRDIGERKRAQAQVRRLSLELTLAEERERKLIARDLHDGPGQLLHLMKIKLDKLSRGEQDSARQRQLGDLDALLAETSLLVRTLTAQLSPAVLDTLGLVPALSWLADDLEHRFGLKVEIDDDGAQKPLTQVQATVLFRAVRELLINVVKHAGILQAKVAIRADADGLTLDVEDRGRGISNPGEVLLGTRGFGLASVLERIAYLGGTLEIQAPPGGGARVRLAVPFSPMSDTPWRRLDEYPSDVG